MSYEALTTGCGVVDRSEMGKLALTGPQAAEFLDGQITNDVLALESGDGLYAAFLTPKGKMLGDLRVLRVTDDMLLLICERVALQSLFDQLRKALIGWDAQLHKRTLELGLVSVVGPQAVAVTQLELPAEEHSSVAVEAGWAVRTDLGVDLVVASDAVAGLITDLAARGAAIADETDLEIVRVESGRPRYGIDLDESVIPQEAGINDRAVSFTKGCYVGQETVARLHYKGRPNRHLRGLVLARPVEPGATLNGDGREAGRIASSVVSPRHGPIALALIRRETEIGDELVALSPDAGAEIPARVVALPFTDA